MEAATTESCIMGPSVLPRKPAYRPDLFDPKSLSTLAAVENAVCEFEGLLSRNNFEHIIDDLLSHPNRAAVELALSAISDSTPLADWIMERFPTSPDTFSSSLTEKLLARFSLFFLLAPLPLPILEICKMTDYRRSVARAPKVFETLLAMSFIDDSSHVVDEEEELRDTNLVKKKHKSQRKNKQAMRGVNTVKPESFKALAISVPNTRQDAEEIALGILGEQKLILEYYLDALRLSDMAETIKQGYILQHAPHEPKIGAEVKFDIMNKLSTAQVPSAYPMVQPMTAALYFPSAGGFGEWRILIATRAERVLRETRRKDRKTFQIIFKKIKELSNGHFSDDNQKRLNGPNTEIPIYEAKMTRDLRLVYQVDCIPEDDSEVERQGPSILCLNVVAHMNASPILETVLKVFGIYTHAQLNSLNWDSFAQQLGRKGKEYKHRCTFRTRPHHPGDNVFMPASFPSVVESEQSPPSDMPELPPADLEEVHSLLVLEKYVTFSQGLLNSIIADLEVAYPFQVTSREKAIIEHPHSSYVLGRSGTGKTTTMLFKMLLIERSYHLCRDSVSKPRQIFVTQSRVLAGKVEEYFLKLLESLITASQSLQDLAKLAKAKKPQQDEDGLVDQDDVLNWRSDLPDRFSLLNDHHFPLFITFDRLCKLLEADVHEKKPLGPVPQLDPNQAGAPGRPSTFVSYDIFLQYYWPHFAQSSTKGLDPSLVFSELMGVIKGAEQTLTSTNRFLDRHAYEALSPRTQPTFASQRNVVYTIFEMYLSLKRDRGDFDAADRTHDILKVLETQGVPGQKIDYLYVDEVQDNLLIDALLLRWLCRNPDGLFWAGDTAQTISVGSSFRFDDLKAFLFRVEQKRQETNTIMDPFHRKQEPPRTFQLAINYRSHAGIVNCAHSVIDLITTFWPYAIDALAPEQGVVDGLKPVFFNGWDTDTVRYEQFLFGDAGSHIEFGAQQCILVRDDAAREKLQEQVGDVGLIMTLYESKGLEFNDVLLYNFFEDSTAELSQWRVVLCAGTSAYSIDERRYGSVCSELKFLYVAITRARKNMWIADSSKKGEPMRVFWTSRNQIQNCTPGADVPQLAVSSSADEWASKGKELFERKKYLQARHCYERASLPRKAASANAYYLREQARKTPAKGSRQARLAERDAFLRAAEAFRDCAVSDTLRNRRTYFRVAGECFERAGDDRQAARAYIDAEEFNDAAKLYRKAGMFDEAVEVIKMYGCQMLPAVVDSITDVARLFYFTEQKLEQASELFSSHEEVFEYLEDRDLNVVHATLLESLGRSADAAELHLAEGRTLKAIRLFLKDKENEESMRRGNKCILQGLWGNISFGISPDKTNTVVLELLDLAAQLNISLLESSDRDEIVMFKAIISGASAELRQLGDTFLLAKNYPAALLCLDHHFINPPRIQVMNGHQVADILGVFFAYARLLHDMAVESDPCSSPSIQKLFGFRSQTENVILIPEGTFLHLILDRYQPTVLRSTVDGVLVSNRELSRIFRQFLCDHLRHRVQEENAMCHKARTFSPCLTFAVFGNCNRPNGVECPQEHSTSSYLNPDSYNVRIRIHLQQVLIFQTLFSIAHPPEMAIQQRLWLGRLYEALNPPFYLLGTPANLNVALIPEAQKGFQVVKEWIRNLVYKLDHWPQTPFLTTLMRAAYLSFTFDRKQASGYMYRARCMTTSPFPQEYYRGPGEYIVPELLASLEGAQVWCLSGGVLFVKHVVQKRLPVNIAVFCDFIDYLCSSFVLYNRYQYASILHDVTLPRSWLLMLAKIEERDVKAAGLFWMLIDPMSELLEQMYSGINAEYLLFESRNLSNLGNMIPAVFIARICRALCLLGYNIKDFKFRFNIRKAITSLRKADRRFSPLYSRYVYAQHWDNLARVVRHSTSESPMDEMINILHASRVTNPLHPLAGVRRVVYNTRDEIPTLLLDTATSSADVLSLRLEDSPSLSTHDSDHFGHNNTAGVLLGPVAVIDGDEKFHGDGGDAEELEVDQGTDTDTISGSADMPQALESVAPSEEECHAASVIQLAYRRALARRRGSAKDGLPEARSRFFAVYYKQYREMEWPNRYYRLLFLGPIPHILLCLDAVETHTRELKGKTKERLLQARHLELEQLGGRLTQIIGILKHVKRLRRALGPESDLHRHRDLEKLKACVVEAGELLCQPPPFGTPELRGDLDIALKGIVAVRQPPKRTKLKPKLCVDEDM